LTHKIINETQWFQIILKTMETTSVFQNVHV